MSQEISKKDLQELKDSMSFEFQRTTAEIFEAIQLFSARVDEKFDRIDARFAASDDRFSRIEKRLNRVEALMVTKDYLDEKLGVLRGDLISATRRMIGQHEARYHGIGI